MVVDSPHLQVVLGFEMEVNSHHDEASFIDRKTGTSFVVRIPRSNISRYLHAPLWLAVVTSVSLLLAVSDIPRTGSTYFANDYRIGVRPGVTMYWGPYAYHVAHLHLTSNSSSTDNGQRVEGLRDGDKLKSLDVWPYKYDTLSISPRAIAGHLNVARYPPCLLYRERCKSSTLPLETVFAMLDDLVQSVKDRLFGVPSLERSPLGFMTSSNWLDRLHHRFYTPVSRNPDRRLHDLYHLSSRGSYLGKGGAMTPRILCGDQHPQPFPARAKPKFCDDPIAWKSEHPINKTSDSPVLLWDHIAIRFAALQHRYAELELDLTIFITSLHEKSRSDWYLLPTISFTTDSLEITTLIRGRHCITPGECRTIFVDDYRYERASLESDENEWVQYVVVLRWISQVYVWIRVGFLWTGCFLAGSREHRRSHNSISSKLVNTGATFLKIPAHIVVYGSWVPLVGYSLAHFFDSGLVQTVGEFAWSSVGGFYSFKPIEYVVTASIQMRNIWMIALFWKVIFFLRRAFSRSEPDGLIVFRGGWISVISWLTTFGLMRALRFRDTNIVRLVELPRHTTTSFAHNDRNNSDYGVYFDIKCAFAATVFVFCAGWIIQKIVRLTTGRETHFFFTRTRYVPLSAGTLWSVSQLDTFWLVRFRRSDASGVLFRSPSMRLLSTRTASSVAPTPLKLQPLTTAQCRVCGFQSSAIHWRSVQGCRLHEPILDVHRRSEALWSMVRLMNIANMTEPVQLFRLYVTGMPLFLYRVHSGDQRPYSLLLPTRMESTSDASTSSVATSHWATTRAWNAAALDNSVVYELLHVVDSRDVPWHVLVNCG